MLRKKSWSPRICLINLFAIALILSDCNNSDRSEDTSTTTDTMNTNNSNSGMAPVGDTTTNSNIDTSTAKTTKTTTTLKKKKGRVTASVEPVNKSLKVEIDKSGVYETTEVRPSFPGGQSAIDDYINSNFEYPDNAVDNNTQGKVIVQFTVNENGKVSDAKVIGRKAGDGLDEEAERVISRMPKWNPGTVKGKPVKTKMAIPLAFRVEE